VTADSRSIYLTDKNGGISVYDSETGTRAKIVLERNMSELCKRCSSKAYWVVKNGSYGVAKRSLISSAISDDGKILCVGGGDNHVHIIDTTSRRLIKSYDGHQEAISGMVFQAGTRKLFSCSYDRTVKVWDLEDVA